MHLDIGFPDIAGLAQGCRFDDCRHEQEPGCAVRGAPEVPPERLASFHKLSQEIDQRLRPGFGKPGGPTILR
jgi:ribosome biogenesis GTPase